MIEMEFAGGTEISEFISVDEQYTCEIFLVQLLLIKDKGTSIGAMDKMYRKMT